MSRRRQGLEAERRDLRAAPRRDDRVDAPQRRAGLQRGALHVAQQRGEAWRRRRAGDAGERVAREQHRLAARDRVAAQVAPPRLAHRVVRQQPPRDIGELGEDGERHHAPARVASDAERVRDLRPPRAHQRDLGGGLVAGDDRLDGGASLRAARARPRSAGPTTERTPRARAAPRRGGSCPRSTPSARRRAARQLAPDLAPGGGAVGAPAHRVAGAQERGDRLADGVVDDEPLAPELDERQRAQALERRLRRLGGQRPRPAART